MAILLVEDEPGITDFVGRGLEAAGFSVVVESEGLRGLRTAQGDGIELVVLDLGLPGLSGEELLRRLRAARPALPVIVLTAKAGVGDRVANLDAGADDYVVKPFSFSELLARIRARLRQPDQSSPVVLQAGDIAVDLLTRVVRVEGAEVNLSWREFTLLEVLLRHAGHVLSQPQLLDQVWGYDFDGSSNVVETYVRYLRRKIGPHRIETIRGAGYRLVSG